MNQIISFSICLAILVGVLAACGDEAEGPVPSGKVSASSLEAAVKAIKPDLIKTHIEKLASDDFQGRGPGTMGAARARDYIIEELVKCKAKPGNGGHWHQDVPMREVACSNQRLVFSNAAGDRWEPTNGQDYVLGSLRGPGAHAISGREVVFVGHGVQAPEHDWDDFEGLDCKDKVLVMLVGDPPCEDQSLFGGSAMTYYGRWTYKYEKARELGAAACLVVHRTAWAGYGWPVVFNSWGRPRMDLLGEDPNQKYGFRGWLTWDAAERLVRNAAPEGLDALAEKARSRDFKPVSLGWTAQCEVTNKQRKLEDVNVVGIMEGSDPKLADEWVIFTAHYDHLGIDEGAEAKGQDGIFNGALDNASGVAGILALARAWGKLDPKPRRSAMFLFVGSEEKGLLGSRYYAEKPLVPHAKTLANINVDGLAVREVTEDVEVVGSGQSELEDILKEVLAAAGRRVEPDSESEKGYYYRSDHFNFARVGIPALYIKSGKTVTGKPKDYLKNLGEAWRKNDYHRPSDEFDSSWSCAGGAADIEALFRVGIRVADAPAGQRPAWKPGSEFRSVRKKSLGS
jgi:Zn-dependent M28 family amino/carboxypeptidase